MIGADEFVTPAWWSDPLREEVLTPKTGRPTLYTEDVGYAFCMLIAEGKTTHQACQEPGMPHPMTVQSWRKRFPAFAEMLEDARDARLEMRAEQCIEIADDTTNDYVNFHKDDGSVTVKESPELLERVKVRLSERHRNMAKEHPGKYGDHTAQPSTQILVQNTAAPAAVAAAPPDPVDSAITRYLEIEAADK